MKITEGVLADFIARRIAKRMLKDMRKIDPTLEKYEIEKMVTRASEQFEKDIKKVPREHIKALFGI